MICIYHSKDLDGYTSGAIVKRKFPEVKLIGYDYGQPFPWDSIEDDETVIMIDVSLPMQEMDALAAKSKDLVWIDHHISAINDYKKFIEHEDVIESTFLEIYGHAVLENGISACEGGWKYFFPDEAMPTAVKLLGEYDTWRNGDKERWEQAILPFQYGMRQICSSPEMFPVELFNWYDIITDNPVYRIIHDGKLIMSYQAQMNAQQCKRAAFEAEFKGLRAICLNGGGLGSDTFKSVYDESKHDIMMPFQFNGKFWTVSLYSTKPEVDCSAICKSMGGGGHKGAAGFTITDISTIFNISPILIT